MKTILYLGLQAPAPSADELIVHHPIIQLMPRPPQDPAIQQALSQLPAYTHIIFTSQSTVSLFFAYAPHMPRAAKTYMAVGRKTAEKIRSFGGQNILIAEKETAEGVTQALKSCNLTAAFLFWPHAALARPIIKDWLLENAIPHHTCVFYDTIANPCFPRPDLSQFDEIVFTSPSTIDAFLSFYESFPRDIKLTSIGPITENYLKRFYARLKNPHVVG